MVSRRPLTNSTALVALILPLLVAACGGEPPTPVTREAELSAQMHRRGVTPMLGSASIHNASSPSGAHLTYYGGQINANTHVVPVLWGTGSYASQVSGTGTPSMTSFFTQFMQHTTLLSGLLAQYNTASQTFTSGTVGSLVTITPSTGGTTVADTAIQSELTAQIAAGHLPAPTLDSAGHPNTYYTVFFPPGITITQGSSSSCVAGGFCAYHGTVASGGGHNEYYYGVHPDMQPGSGCATGCGNGTTFGNYCSVTSHELVEMMTDAEVGIAGPIAAPLAWYDSTNGEIGDICNAQQGTFTGCDSQSYTYQLEFSNAAANGNACVGISATSCGGGSDFTIAASPSAVTVAAGSSGSSTISTSAVGTAGTVSLSVSGAPAGVTASLSPTSVTAGGSSTLTITVASGTAAGSATLTVTGTEGAASHSATVALTITGGGGGGGALTNGGFESGSLSGWTTAGASETAVNSGCHSGTWCARLGSTSPTNGDSTITQTFTAATGNTGISLWYKETCPDSVTYDWALATLKDNTSGTTATLIAKACATNAWTNVTGTVTAGHSYTLSLTSHDDNYASDPTYTLFDDVALTSGGGGGGCPGATGIANGGFESGTTGWTLAGSAASIAGGHSGSNSLRLGLTTPTNGDSTAAQTFQVPTGKSQLSVWYKVTCPDTVTYDWATITLGSTTVLGKTCTNSGAWVNVTTPVTACSTYTLTLTSHDDNYSSDPTYTLFDDATLN